MKKVFKFLLIGLFLYATFVVYEQYKRVHPPVDFSYSIPTEIDSNYHAIIKLNNYYDLCFEVESLAQKFWYDNLINIQADQQTYPIALTARRKHLQKLRIIKAIEKDLIQSKSFKNKGYTNFDIKKIEQVGLQNFLQAEKELFFQEGLNILAEKGQYSRLIYFTQVQLNLKGFTIKEDGIFNLETENALASYQKSINHLPTGLLDQYTFRKLVKTP